MPGRYRLPAAPRWPVVALAVPCAASILAAGWGLPTVIRTGMCPAAPPDVAPYPCAPEAYLLRMTFGPWALVGIGWGLAFVVRSWRQQLRRHDASRRAE